MQLNPKKLYISGGGLLASEKTIPNKHPMYIIFSAFRPSLLSPPNHLKLVINQKQAAGNYKV